MITKPGNVEARQIWGATTHNVTWKENQDTEQLDPYSNFPVIGHSVCSWFSWSHCLRCLHANWSSVMGVNSTDLVWAQPCLMHASSQRFMWLFFLVGYPFKLELDQTLGICTTPGNHNVRLGFSKSFIIYSILMSTHLSSCHSTQWETI